jgi:hypothetical protein
MNTNEKVLIGIGVAAVLIAVFGKDEILMLLEPGLKNNNPGNLIDNGTAWKGKIGTYQASGHTFVKFDTPLNGIRANTQNAVFLFQGLADPNLYNFGVAWAPPEDNGGSDQYGISLGKYLNVDPNASFDFVGNMAVLVQAICNNENSEVPPTWPWSQGALEGLQAKGLA